MFSNTQAVPHEDQDRVIIDRELDESFETLPLAQYGLQDGLLLSRLKGQGSPPGHRGSSSLQPRPQDSERCFAIALLIQEWLSILNRSGLIVAGLRPPSEAGVRDRNSFCVRRL